MYNDYDDQELIYLIREGNEDASNIIYEKYSRLALLKAKKHSSYGKKLGLEYNDLFQEGMVGLSEAIHSYNDSKNTKFCSFANVCIERQILSALLFNGRKKHSALNNSCSLDAKLDDKGKTILDFLFDDGSDPSIKLEIDENNNELDRVLNEELTSFEKQVFDLRTAGFEYKEICDLLNKSYKSIDSALQRIRFKIKKCLINIDEK